MSMLIGLVLISPEAYSLRFIKLVYVLRLIALIVLPHLSPKLKHPKRPTTIYQLPEPLEDTFSVFFCKTTTSEMLLKTIHFIW